jgi:hypothetical protein
VRVNRTKARASGCSRPPDAGDTWRCRQFRSGSPRGVGGYFLGKLGQDGSSTAKHTIAILGVVDAVVGVAAVVLAATFKVNLGPFPVY